MKKIFPVLVLLFLFSIFFWPVSVFGQECGGPDQPPCSSIGYLNAEGDQVGNRPMERDEITIGIVTSMVTRGINWFSWFVAVVSVIMGLYSGMLFITARGNTAQLETARQILIYAVIGITVAIISFSIVVVTKTFVGVV